MTTEWEIKYPLVTLHALDSGVSDHRPSLLDTRASFMGMNKPFKTELSWFSGPDFYDQVVLIWNKQVKSQNSVQNWNKKMSDLRKHLRGWAAHTNGIYKQQKNSLQSTITNLDVAAENCTLSKVERDQLD
jgi:hypothetical protein